MKKPFVDAEIVFIQFDYNVILTSGSNGFYGEDDPMFDIDFD